MMNMRPRPGEPGVRCLDWIEFSVFRVMVFVFQVSIFKYDRLCSLTKKNKIITKKGQKSKLSGYSGGHQALFCAVWSGNDTIMSLLKLNQEKKKRRRSSWNFTAHHLAICHTSAAPRNSHVLRPELDCTRPNWARLTQAGTSNTAQNIERHFPFSSLPWFSSPSVPQSLSTGCSPTVCKKFKG